jgi:hypothetical protein
LDSFSFLIVYPRQLPLQTCKHRAIWFSRDKSGLRRSRILVLQNGQIAEQGSFKELIQLEDGIFASMWADQVSSSDDVGGGSVKKKASGYSVGVADVDGEPDSHKLTEIPPEDFVATEIIHGSELSEAVADAVTSDERASLLATVDHPEGSVKTKSVDEDKSAPTATVGFPSFVFPIASEPLDMPDERAPTPAAGPSVTFGSSINSPPSRTGTPDPESEPKRKRISSQNFQRLARRISLTTRRQGSSSSILTGIPGIPGLGKRDSSPKVSIDEGSRAESSTGPNMTDSPSDSGKGDDKPKLKKKDKKGKKGSF